jgi:hypothetical protein
LLFRPRKFIPRVSFLPGGGPHATVSYFIFSQAMAQFLNGTVSERPRLSRHVWLYRRGGVGL